MSRQAIAGVRAGRPGVGDRVDGALVIVAPPATEGWDGSRFGGLRSTRAGRLGRALRFAEERERVAFGSNHERLSGDGRALDIKQQEVS